MTCIRGGANYGQELWAGQSGPDANQLLKDEYQILKMLIGSYRRPHRAAVRWLMRLLPLDSVAAIQQLKFIRNIRRGGRELELEEAALFELQMQFKEKKRAWWKVVVNTIKQTSHFKGLEDEDKADICHNGGLDDKILVACIDAIKTDATQGLKAQLIESKHEFLLHSVPEWESPRPWSCMSKTSGGSRGLTRWMLGES